MTRIIRFPGTMNVQPGHPKFYIPTIFDDFNRQDGRLEGSTTTLGGKVWSGSVYPKIDAGQLSMADVPATTRLYVSMESPDYEVQTVLTGVGSTPATAAGGVLVRNTGLSGDYAWLSTRISSSTPGYVFWQNIGGTLAAVGTSYPVAPQPGDALKIRAEGATLTAWVNGVLACTATTSVLMGNDIGFMPHISGKSSRWDSFSAAEL